MSIFLVVAPLAAQEPDRNVPAAKVGAVYAHALATSQRASFKKSGGNADWLTVTPDGILTGTPPSDASPRAEITVTAYPQDRQGERSPLVRSFVVRVEGNNCIGGGAAFAWCDAQPAKTANPPGGRAPSIFSPRNLTDFAQIEGLDQSGAGCPGANGCIVQFHRLRGDKGEFGNFIGNNIVWSGLALNGTLGTQIVDAINASKVFISGSVFVYQHVDDCSAWSWSVVTQTEESSNNLVYEPSDLTFFCSPPSGKQGTLLVVLPVHAIWASVYPRPANTYDPTWKAPSGPPGPNPCVPAGSIRPCDVAKNKPIRGAGWVYSRLALPGVSQGSISVSPIMPATKSTWDVQLYTSTLLGYGWAGFQVLYEHDRKSNDDLNSLTAALSYDMRLPRRPDFWASWGSVKADHQKCGSDSNGDCSPPYLGLRPPELNLRFGPEYSPDAFSYTPKTGSTTEGATKPSKEYLPRDLNLVGAATLRLPIVLSPLILRRQEPSQISIAPVGGLEAGVRMISNGILTAMPCPVSEPPQCAQPQMILRRVGGFDASSRWPYNITKNFLGDRPVTIDYSYRIRWLNREEPFSNQMWVIKDNNTAAYITANSLTPPGWPLLTPASGQSLGARIYQRVTFIAPFSAYLQFRATWQHGALPPMFQFVGNEVTLGLAFSNPGSSEH